jgi:hypothetical protein
MLIRKIKIEGKKVRLVKRQGQAKDDIMITIGLYVFFSRDLRCLILMMVVDANPLNKDFGPPGDVTEGNTFSKVCCY